MAYPYLTNIHRPSKILPVPLAQVGVKSLWVQNLKLTYKLVATPFETCSSTFIFRPQVNMNLSKSIKTGQNGQNIQTFLKHIQLNLAALPRTALASLERSNDALLQKPRILANWSEGQRVHQHHGKKGYNQHLDPHVSKQNHNRLEFWGKKSDYFLTFNHEGRVWICLDMVWIMFSLTSVKQKTNI